MQNMSSDQVSASSVHVVCMWDAEAMHDKALIGQSVWNTQQMFKTC